MKIKNVVFHRNGISGQGFFIANIVIGNKELLATFADLDNLMQDITCRVINPKDMGDCYRGDNIAMMLHDRKKQIRKILDARHKKNILNIPAN
jgi:hypothetical protein